MLKTPALSKIAALIGITASVGSICFWLLFVLLNPVNHGAGTGPLLTTFLMLALPAFIFVYASLRKKPPLMFIAFVTSLPLGAMFMGSPIKIYRLYGLVLVFYGAATLFMKLGQKKPA